MQTLNLIRVIVHKSMIPVVVLSLANQLYTITVLIT